MIKKIIISMVGYEKYLFSILLTVLAAKENGMRYFFIGLTEVIIIMLISNMLIIRKRKAGIILNCILMLLYNVQMLILYFSKSFLLLIMLTNIDSIQGLSGHAGRYFAGAVLVIFFSVIPIREQKRIKSSALQKLLSFSLTIELIFTLLWGNMYSPL